jgi:hypothetical protein
VLERLGNRLLGLALHGLVEQFAAQALAKLDE